MRTSSPQERVCVLAAAGGLAALLLARTLLPALPALQAALGAYDQLEVRAVEPDQGEAARGSEAAVVRAELVLARSSALPLAEVGLEPDPLQSFAVALSRTKHERGEQAVVAVDVM